jgi:hypothetical protein
MPGHVKRLPKKMVELIKGASFNENNLKPNEYVDLFLTYEECDSDNDRDQNNKCPPIRYYFSFDN